MKKFLETKAITIVILSLILSNCSTHSVTLGEMTIYGSNEQSIPEPVRE